MSLLDRIVEARRISVARERLERAREVRDRGTSRLAAPSSVEGLSSPRPDDPPGRVCRPMGAGTSGPEALSGTRPFEESLRASGRRIIAEIKRRSPSAGTIREPLDPREIASRYERAGAAAISVLTEPDFFGGSDDDLIAARSCTALPVLRKDFLLDEEQVAESRAVGADAVLLIAAILPQEDLARLLARARRLGLGALVEVHDDAELDRALESGASIVGVNCRDLRDFSVSLPLAERLAQRIPDGVVRVAESGIRGRDDVLRLEQAGYGAFLVGESLLRSPDPGERLQDLLS